MEEKLETLAIAKRRLTSTVPLEELCPPNLTLTIQRRWETEDRKSGNFPYDDNTVQSIRDFYAGKDILITGGTGFVGKVLIEKILRSLPEGGRIYLLLRGKKGVSPQQRVRAMLELPLFKLVMTENPKAGERLVTIEGDCGTLGLGLSKDDRQTIIDNVSIVFHGAATVRFNQPFSDVVLLNTRGTREMVYLCKDLKKLHAFVHISTAFTCATRNRKTPIPEEILPAGVDWRKFIAAAEKSSRSLKKDGFNLIFEKLGTEQPNNYTLSKLLAENLVEDLCRDMPAIVVRPSVLIGSYEDPFGGWVDNLYGPLSIWDAIGRGILRTQYAVPSVALDVLPVDFHVKILIAAAWHRGLGYRTRSDGKINVVNNCTSNVWKQTFEDQYRTLLQIIMKQTAHKYALRYPRFWITNNYWIFWLITISSHLPLGILVDPCLRLTGRKPILLQAYRRIFFAQTNFTHHFCTREFQFHDKWQWTLNARIPEKDKARFSWITTNFYGDFAIDNINGIKKYVFKEEPVKIEESNLKIVYIVDWIQNIMLAALGLWIVRWIISG